MKQLRKADLIIIVTLAIVAGALWLLNRLLLTGKGEYAEIYHNSKLVRRIKLSTATAGSFSLPGEPDVVFRIDAAHSIAFIKSDCPDKVCIRSGRLKLAGQFAVCLPNRIVLKIVAAEQERDGPDLIIE